MKKLRVGIIGGGGPGSFFGRLHQRAILIDGTRELVAGALRSSAEGSMEAADEWDIQGYPDYQSMIAAYTAGELELDYATIVTPNHAHFGPAKACLEAGLPLMCEKPMTLTVPQSEEIVELVKSRDVPFVLAHTYTGHPMMMVAKEMIANGDIGEIRKVEAWYNQGWLATQLESGPDAVQQAKWRTDPTKAGISNCGGDIGTHAFVAATWVTGLSITRVNARLNRFVSDRLLDDDFNVVGELSNGGTVLITTTQIGIGHKNDHGFRIFGTKGSLEWHQERAEKLIHRTDDQDHIYWIGTGAPVFSDTVSSYLRAPSGHHEDFLEALANLHCTLERQIRARRGEEVPAPFPHPGAEEGLNGMKFVRAAVDSSAADMAWTEM